MPNQKKQNTIWTVILIGSIVFACVCSGFLISGIKSNLPAQPEPTEPPAPTEPLQAAIMDTYDDLVAVALEEAYEAANDVTKVFWIADDALVAPVPNATSYGETNDPSSLQWLLDEAATVLDGQTPVFHTDVEIVPYSTVNYYLDDSIFVVAWQEIRDNYVYTFAEIKVTHPSQFRRYLGNHAYDSGYINSTTRMANSVNAVVASSADFYLGRNHGIIVYEGIVRRTNYSELVDTCFVDQNGDLILVPAGELITMEEAQAFVDEHEIEFSLAFGPILVQDGVRCDPQSYYLGEINENYPRAALCQMDQLHYVVVTSNKLYSYDDSPTIRTFTNHIAALGPKYAYTLDGGQTATISMNGQAVNPRPNGERWISDIIYWGSAIPNEPAENTEP